MYAVNFNILQKARKSIVASSEAFTAVKIQVEVFRVVRPCNFVVG
jgi:hypothetical protein